MAVQIKDIEKKINSFKKEIEEENKRVLEYEKEADKLSTRMYRFNDGISRILRRRKGRIDTIPYNIKDYTNVINNINKQLPQLFSLLSNIRSFNNTARNMMAYIIQLERNSSNRQNPMAYNVYNLRGHEILSLKEKCLLNNVHAISNFIIKTNSSLNEVIKNCNEAEKEINTKGITDKLETLLDEACKIISMTIGNSRYLAKELSKQLDDWLAELKKQL